MQIQVFFRFYREEVEVIRPFVRLFQRWRYPVSLPEEVAEALGVPASSYLRFDEFINFLSSTGCCPTRLYKFMSRPQAEAVFASALRKERFQLRSMFSYYFNEGWLEFLLLFDEQGALRRLYVQHRDLHTDRGVEIRLCPRALLQNKNREAVLLQAP